MGGRGLGFAGGDDVEGVLRSEAHPGFDGERRLAEVDGGIEDQAGDAGVEGVIEAKEIAKGEVELF